MTTTRGWTVLDDSRGVLTRTYQFAKEGFARCMVARYRDDELLVISPPSGLSEEDIKSVESHGRLTAIIAPNGLHHLGITPWKDVFPSATVYAPDAARARIGKKYPDIEIEALAELRSRIDPEVDVVEVPGFKMGETWVKVQTGRGPIWYVSDSCFNLPELPKAFAVRLLFKWTKTAPGFRINNLGNTFFLKDKAGYKQWFIDQVDAGAPGIVVPAHGDVVQEPGLGTRLKQMVEERL